MELLSRSLLRALEVHESEHASGPTVLELAANLGIPRDFGHHHLVERLKRQVVLGRVSHSGGRFHLTEVGRKALAGNAALQPPPPEVIHQLTEATS